MRILLSIMSLTLACGVVAAQQDGAELRVMSFNVRYGTANDGPNSWEHRKDILIDTIRDASPDVIGTQECLDFQAAYVVEQLPAYEWFGVGREADGSGEHMAVLYRKDLLRPLDMGHFWLSETPDTPGSMSWSTACTRMVTWLRFEHVPSGVQFTFYNTHLDHRSSMARLEGARLIAARLEELAPEEPIVLTGDFNCAGGTSEPWHCLSDAGMADAWENCARRSGPATTWCGFSGPDETEGRRIDWVLTRGPIQTIETTILTTNSEGRYPSDHLPVLATVRIDARTDALSSSE